MKHPRVIVNEGDGKLAARLRPATAERGWLLRQRRRTGASLRHLKGDGPCVLVLRIGRDLEREFALLEHVGRRYPDVAAVVVGDIDHAGLAPLAWDLGAAYFLVPPYSYEQLIDLVVALMPVPESVP